MLLILMLGVVVVELPLPLDVDVAVAVEKAAVLNRGTGLSRRRCGVRAAENDLVETAASKQQQVIERP
jgi:hypothetical protein